MNQLSAEGNKHKLMRYLHIGGISFIIAGSLGHFFDQPLFKYIFGVASLILIVSQLIEMLKARNPDFKQKRLLRMNMMLSLMLALATYSMFDGTTLWIAVVLIYALITLYMSFRS
jgi:uncharacterized membrane protein YfcA